MSSQKIPRKKNNKLVITVIVIVICTAAVYGVKRVSGRSLGSPAQQSVQSRALGNPAAPIKIVEFMDFQCPACSKGALFLSDFVKKNPNQIYLSVKYFPLEAVHRHAIRSAMYAECTARQGKFWPFLELVFKKQNEWSNLINADPAFIEIAKTTGIDQGRLDACIDDQSINAVLIQEKMEGKKLGVQSTPTYFVNGKMAVGVKSLEDELMVLMGRIKN